MTIAFLTIVPYSRGRQMREVTSREVTQRQGPIKSEILGLGV
jgi:hypothetical protein